MKNKDTNKRLIDAYALEEEINEQGTNYHSKDDVIAAIAKQPAVNAVEVVRCGNCQHSKPPAVLTQKYGEPGTLTCYNWHSPCNKRNVNKDDFCSYGERKSNG